MTALKPILYGYNIALTIFQLHQDGEVVVFNWCSQRKHEQSQEQLLQSFLFGFCRALPL